MITRLLLFSCLLCLNIFKIQAQQLPDTLFTPQVNEPKYPKAKGPIVAIDGGHHNRHQLSGTFAPFGKLLSADGYQMQAIEEFSPETLTEIDVLVIVNAI